jgi:putative transposase
MSSEEITMRKARFTEHQIIAVLKSVEAGRTVKGVCREAGISEASYYNWKKKFAGLGVTELRRLRQLEDENQRLKKLVADLSLDKEMLQEVLKQKF